MRKTILARAILLGSAASFIAIPAQAQTAEETTQQAADQPPAPEATAAANDEGADTPSETIIVTSRRTSPNPTTETMRVCGPAGMLAISKRPSASEKPR